MTARDLAFAINCCLIKFILNGELGCFRISMASSVATSSEGFSIDFIVKICSTECKCSTNILAMVFQLFSFGWLSSEAAGCLISSDHAVIDP